MVTIDSGVSSTKHMCMQMHLVLEAVKDKHVDIKYRNTKQMIADEFTKPLDGAKSETFRSEILHLSDWVNLWFQFIFNYNQGIHVCIKSVENCLS